MPFHFWTENGILRGTLSGVVTNRDLDGLLVAVEKIERASAVVPHRIVDLTDATGMELGFTDMRCLADHRRSLSFPNSFKSAIVAAEPIHVGFARMFQTLNDHPKITIRIFPTVAAASAWVAEI